MPVHLLPKSRRQFLQTSLAGGIATLVGSTATAAPNTDPNYWALLADTHIAGDQASVARGTNMFDNLNRVIDQILAEPSRPSGVIINGDCAYLKGLGDDYATLSKALGRLVEAKIPIHLTMGNHDDRGPMYHAFADQRADNPPVDGKHVTVIKTEKANLLLLDSLRVVNNVTGELGKQQLLWLDQALKSNDDKPALIFGHHNPQHVPEGSTAKVSGLADTSEFIETLHAHPHAQAYFYGHTHDWKLSKTDGQVQLINQPPVAYVFNKSRPNGWVSLRLNENSFSIELRALNNEHKQHGEKHVIEARLEPVAG